MGVWENGVRIAVIALQMVAVDGGRMSSSFRCAKLRTLEQNVDRAQVHLSSSPAGTGRVRPSVLNVSSPYQNACSEDQIS